jgi:hypothetical protein
VRGRIFADLLLSDLLLLYVPNVTVFMDLRAQSIYTDETCRQYLSVALVNPRNHSSVASALAILDRHSVSAVVLPTDSEYWVALIETLLDSKAWLPMYVDTSGFVFVKSESDLLKDFRHTGTVDRVWFPGERAKLLTLAHLMLSSRGKVEPKVVQGLMKEAMDQPASLIYRVIARSSRGDNGCLTREAKSYLLGEFNRLTDIGFSRSGGYDSILGSMLEILNILLADALTCPAPKEAQVYQSKMDQLRTIMDKVRKRYSPWPYD